MYIEESTFKNGNAYSSLIEISIQQNLARPLIKKFKNMQKLSFKVGNSHRSVFSLW
jgi:hypothetical protein